MMRFGIELNLMSNQELQDKFIQGVNLAIQKLIDKSIKEDAELVISKGGKVVRVKARDLK
jgi:hypothetical protein